MSVFLLVGLSVYLSVCLSICLPATSFIEVLCSWYCIYVVSIIVAQIIRSFCSHILQFQMLQQLQKSQCLSVCLSVRSKFYGSVMLFIIVVTVVVVYDIRTFCCHIISCDSSSISRNVCQSVCLSVYQSVYLPAASFIEVLCCWQCIYVVSIIVPYIIRSFCSHIFQFWLLQQLYKSQCRSVCLSIRNKFYGSVMLLLVHNCCYCCCSL